MRLDGETEETVSTMAFSPRDLAGIVGTAIELVSRYKAGSDVENPIIALQETIEYLDFEQEVLFRPAGEAPSV